jgi:hypothetical protein
MPDLLEESDGKVGEFVQQRNGTQEIEKHLVEPGDSYLGSHAATGAQEGELSPTSG